MQLTLGDLNEQVKSAREADVARISACAGVPENEVRVGLSPASLEFSLTTALRTASSTSGRLLHASSELPSKLMMVRTDGIGR